ncbi:hypothetical protein [Streptococcus porci]|uniref:hypothetical protein n=1 Tax=Streptococcus porci TaxID=502567 RepID=UPI00040B929B|nr:hypothetical protein [Streptococcus porci]
MAEFKEGLEIIKNLSKEIKEKESYLGEIQEAIKKIDISEDVANIQELAKNAEKTHTLAIYNQEKNRVEKELDMLKNSTKLYYDLKDAIQCYREKNFNNSQKIDQEINEHLDKIKELYRKRQGEKGKIISAIYEIIGKSENYLPEEMEVDGAFLIPKYSLEKFATGEIFTDSGVQSIFPPLDFSEIAKLR